MLYITFESESKNILVNDTIGFQKEKPWEITLALRVTVEKRITKNERHILLSLRLILPLAFGRNYLKDREIRNHPVYRSSQCIYQYWNLTKKQLLFLSNTQKKQTSEKKSVLFLHCSMDIYKMALTELERNVTRE